MNKIKSLEINNLTKIINNKKIVEDISLTLYSGEVFGLLGPNGAGKTTTIRMILGLIKPSSGEVKIYGRSLSKSFEEAISNIGAIIESPEFYRYMSGYQNLLQYARMYNKKIPKSRIDEVVSLVGLDKAIHNRVKEYSLGMRQRLGLAQALLHNPKILILDEPTNGLDPSGIHELRNFLRTIAKEQNITVLVSSHILTEMQLLCDRVAIINKGKLVAVETIDNDNSKQIEVIFRLGTNTDNDNISKILDYLNQQNFCTKIEYEKYNLILNCKEDVIPTINRYLVNANIDVYSIYNNTKSLEKLYLNIVEGAE